MFLKQDDQISSYKTAYDVDKGNGFKYKESSMLTYHVIEKQSDGNGPVFLNESISRYLDIYYTKKEVNWNLPQSNGRVHETKVLA